MEKPLIGITAGDPAGIGPEIVLKSLKNKQIYDISRPVVISCIDELEKAEGILKTGLIFNCITSPNEGKYLHGSIDIIPLDFVNSSPICHGKVQAKAGEIAYKSILKATKMAKSCEIDAIATAPINKEALRASGVDHIGHTEIFSSLTGAEDLLTMFQVRNLKVFFLSRHVSLRKACDMVKKDRIIDYIARCSDALKRLGIKNPKMALAGLNPHSGEHGLFGDEEITEICPAISYSNQNKIDVEGPIPADSVFYLALKGRYDAVLSLYHDQGHIATKTLDFERTISLTIGMPFIRTSVDHGTAFDIAGKGIAGSVSMEEAIRLAAFYSRNYVKNQRRI